MTAKEVELMGGSPWGFRMHGGIDVNQPLRISRVNPGRKAALSGIREGDVISSINNVPTKNMTNAEAHSMLKNSGNVLKLGLNEDTGGSPRRRSGSKSNGVELKRPSQLLAEVQISRATPQPHSATSSTPTKESIPYTNNVPNASPSIKAPSPSIKSPSPSLLKDPRSRTELPLKSPTIVASAPQISSQMPYSSPFSTDYVTSILASSSLVKSGMSPSNTTPTYKNGFSNNYASSVSTSPKTSGLSPTYSATSTYPDGKLTSPRSPLASMSYLANSTQTSPFSTIASNTYAPASLQYTSSPSKYLPITNQSSSISPSKPSVSPFASPYHTVKKPSSLMTLPTTTQNVFLNEPMPTITVSSIFPASYSSGSDRPSYSTAFTPATTMSSPYTAVTTSTITTSPFSTTVTTSSTSPFSSYTPAPMQLSPFSTAYLQVSKETSPFSVYAPITTNSFSSLPYTPVSTKSSPFSSTYFPQEAQPSSVSTAHSSYFSDSLVYTTPKNTNPFLTEYITTKTEVTEHTIMETEEVKTTKKFSLNGNDPGVSSTNESSSSYLKINGICSPNVNQGESFSQHNDVKLAETSRSPLGNRSPHTPIDFPARSRGGSSKIPSSLKELCVDKIATSEYGNSILKELASVSQSLGEFASEALSREMSAPEVPEKPKFSKLPPALHLEKTPPPVAPRQSSFKMLQEEPPWVGLQSQRDPSVVAYLSPLQRKQIEQTKNFAHDEAGELIDMHCKYAGRRGYNEAVDSEKAPPSSNNNDDKIALQVARPPGEERPAPDTANRLLAIIRDPAVNPNLQQENADRPPESSFDFMETLRTFEDMNRDLSNDTRFRSWSKKGDGVKESMHVVEQHSSNKAYEAAFKNGMHHQSNLTSTTSDLNAKNEKQTNSDTSKTSAIYENVEPQSREHQVPITIEKNDIFNAKSNSNAKEHEVPITIERQSLLNSTSNQSTSSRIIESNKFTSNRGFEMSVKNENIFDLTSKATNGNADSPKSSNQIRDVPITIEKQVLSKNNVESSNKIRDVPISIERQFSELTSKNSIESSKSSATNQIRDVPISIERQFSELTSKNNIESSKSSAVSQIRDMPITIERQFSELTSKNNVESSKSSAVSQIRDMPITIERQFSELTSKNNVESSKSSAVSQIRDMPITIERQFSELTSKNNVESSKSSAVTQIREVPITIAKQGPTELTSKNNIETQLREVPITIEKQAASETTLKNNIEPPKLKFADQIREVPITIEKHPFDPSNRAYEMTAKNEKRDIFDLTLKNRSYTESKLSDIVKAPKLSSLSEESDIFDMTSTNYNVMPKVSEFNIKNDLTSMKSTTSEKVVQALNGNAHEERLINVEKEVVDVKPKEGIEEAKREMQHLLNKRAFILDDPIFDPISVMKENFAIKRRGSLPKDLHERQMQYILLKEKEIEEQIRQLEEEKKLSNFDSVNVSEIKVLKSNDVAKESDQSFLADKYHISRQRDVATFQSDANSRESAKSNKFERSTNLISAPSEGEKFREQMYCEYMDKVAEREERKQHKVIKITNMPNANGDSSAKVAAHPHGDSKSIINDIKLACNKIEEEFITKARERWDKMGFLDSESIVDDKAQQFEEKPVVIEHKIKVLDDDGEKDVKKLPTHLREFVEFTSNGDETGVWSPGAAPSSADAPPPVSKEVVNGEAAASTPRSGAPPPPPPPPPPVWTPRAKGASPVSEKKEFRPVPFESPKLSRKNVPEPPRPERSALPPWEVRLAGSQSAPEAAGLSGLASQASPQPPPAPALPRAQNPTITLLQKAREGQLPRGASYLEHDRDLPNDRRISPPRVRQGEVVYSLRRGYMSEPESGSDRPRKMAEIGPKKYDGIGPTTKDGMPIILRSEVKEANQSKWYKKMYDTIHKNKYDDDYVTVRYKSRRAHPSAIHTAPRSSQYAYFNPRSGYLSEPEGGGGAGGWTSDAYDSDVPQRRHSALDRRRASGKENDVSSPYLSSNKYSTLASAKASQEVYKNQPGRIEDYVPGRSSVIDKESKQWWDEVMDIFDGWLDENSPLPPYSTLLARAIQRSQLANASLQQPPSTNKQSAASSILSKSYMARALKESGYESDSTLVLRRREGGPIDPPLSPQEQKLAYRSLQAGGEPPLQGFRKPAPDKPKDDTEIEYFPLSPTLTRIRVHKNAANERTNDILCYPITSMTNPSDLFAKYQQAVPSFINLDYPKAARYNPPAPPRRLSSKANSTLKLVSSISPNSRLLKTQRDTNVKFLQNRISNKLASNTITKENRKKEVRETKMKSADGKRIKTTRAAISVPNASTKIKTSKTVVSKKIPTDNLKGTSSFSSPRRTMSPIDYVSPTMNRFFNDNMNGSREIIEGGAGRRTPISGILDRGASLDRTFASEKRNLPLKSIQEFPSKLSKSTELISPTDSSKNNKENKYHKTPPGITVKKTTAIYSSARNGGKISDDKTLNVSVAMSPRGRELLRTSDKLITMNKLRSLPSSDIQCQLSNISRHSSSKDKINLSYTNLHPKKSSSKSTLKSRKSLEDVSSKVKSSNSSLNSVRSSKSSVKSSKANDPHKLCKSPKDNQFGDLKADPSLTSKTYKKLKPDADKKQITQANKTKSSKTPKPYDKETLQYLKSVDREIDSYVAQYENNLCVNFNEIHDQRDAIMSDSFFQHLLLRGVPPQAQVEVDPDYHSTSVLEKAKFFQNPSLETSSQFNRPVNSYLSHKKPVTDSKFRSWDRYERSRPRSPRAVSWPGRMSQSCIKKFDSLSRESKSINDVGSSVIFSKIDNRSKSEPPKIVFTQTTRPRSPVVSRLRKSVESPTKIVYQRAQSPPAKIVFSQTSRPLSPVVVHTKKKKPPEPIRLPSPSKIVLTQTSRPVTPVFNKRRLQDPEEIQYIRSRSESPVVKRKSDLSYHSDSESLRKRAASPIKQVAAKHVRKIREQSPSPSPIRSPSCRRIHSARISQCRTDDGIAGLKKKILRTQSAGDAESKKKKMITPEPSFIRSNSFINLDHMRNHLSYQEYITELKHQKAKSDRFKELNRFYSYLERIGELERATSVSDLRPRRRDEEIIDFDKWKRVRAIEKAEEELDRLYKKMKLDQQEKDLLYLPHDAESLKWSKYKDWNLRAKEKSVEDLKEHFIKLADGEVDNVRYSKRDSDYHRDAYKPLWRGSSVMNLATSITKKNQPECVEKTERTPIKTKIEPTVTNIREKLGIGSRLWSSLSMEQVSALKNQLNNIYSKEIDQKAKETPEIGEEYVITVPSTSKEKPKSGLQVRCNSFTVGDAVNEMESNKSLKADSISSIQHLPMDKDMKNSFNTYQNLSEKEKKRISMSLSHEILERMKLNRAKYSPVVLAKETRGATAAARIKGIAKSSSESQSPRTCYSLEVSEDDNKHKNDFVLVLAPNNHSSKTGEEIKSIMDGWSEGKSVEDKKCLSPLRTSSASETETASSDASNKTVIYRSVKDEVQKKVDFFEKNKQESSTGSVIYHARDDSFEDKHDSLQDLDQVQDVSSPPMSLKEDTPTLNKLSYSQSLSSMKDLFGESQKNSALLSPAPKVMDKAIVSSDVKESKANRTNLVSSAVSSMENVSRSRSLSPDPEGYWRAYLSLVKAGEVQKLKRKFEDVDNVFCYEEGVPKLRRYQSDPEIIRTILQHNWNKKNLTNVKMHERGDVDRLTHKYETSSRGRSRFRRYGLTSPILKSPLRVEDREMPHIDVISKIASLKPPKTSAIGGEYPIECPIGEVNKIRQRFEKDDTSLLGQMFTSTPDIHELRDIAPYLSGPWVAHKYPKRQDNNRSLSTSDYITEDKYAPVRKDRPRPKSTSPIRAKTHKPSSILKQQVKKVDVFADQEFDPVKHRPKYRYLPPREEAPARPAFPQQLPAHTTRPTVTFQEPELAPIPPPKGIPIGRDYRSESPRRYVEGDVNIHYRVPVRQEPRPLVPEDELARRQADHMRRVYQEERRRKYLQELQDMNSRRHTDNFTPSQKSPIALNRYDSFGTRQVARALYNFVGQGARELSFRKGDLILVRRQIDNNWYEGEHNNTVGLFPYNYVEMIQYDSTTTPSQRRPTEGRARAKFNFVAQTHLELGLRKGELVTLIRRVDENWYEGRLGDRKGIFPVSYVEVLAEPVFNRSELTPSIVSGKPVASPAAHSMVGAAGAASLGAHHYTPQLNSPALSNSPSSTAPLALPNHGITSHHARPVSATLPRATDHTPINLNNHEPLYVDTNAEAVPYRAMYKYRPQNPDELELQEGETVYVLEKCDDGWYVGSSQRTGRFGTFPGNYVEKI